MRREDRGYKATFTGCRGAATEETTLWAGEVQIRRLISIQYGRGCALQWEVKVAIEGSGAARHDDSMADKKN
jgi:hypothetical protein